MRDIAAGGLRFSVAAVAAFVVSMCLALGLPVISGMQTRIVVSGSMEPQIGTGDAVVARPVPPSEVRLGDVITFSDPEGTGRQFVHRVIAVGREANKFRFTTKGDANSTVERWVVKPDARLGLVLYRVPSAGYALVYMRHPLSQVLLVAVPALVLMVIEVRRIWRRPDGNEVPDAVKL